MRPLEYVWRKGENHGNFLVPEPIFYFSYKRSAKFYKEIYGLLRVAQVGGYTSTQDKFSSCKCVRPRPTERKALGMRLVSVA